MNIKSCFALLFLSTPFAIEAQEHTELESDFFINAIPADQLPPPTAFNSDGGMSAFAMAGAWTDVVYNPNITTAGQWYFGPLMNAPAGTPVTSIVQNITWQWNVFNYDSNLETLLCLGDLSGCINISGNFGAGANLSSDNIPANQSWRYAFFYNGSGTISPPLLGQNGSIAVTYQ